MIKKIIFILLLWSGGVNGQATIINLGGVGMSQCQSPGCLSGGYSASTSNTKTYQIGDTYIIPVFFGEKDPTSVTDGSNSYSLYKRVGQSSHLSLYMMSPTSNYTGAVAAAFNNGSCGNNFFGYRLSSTYGGGNGVSAIRQIVIDSGTSADPTVTMAALAPGSAVIAFLLSEAASFSGQPESGWTLEKKDSCSSFPFSSYSMSRTNTSDNTPTITAASSTWKMIAIEVRQRRRVTLIN